MRPKVAQEAAALQVIQRHSRSFSLAVKFLPAPERDDARLIYAWCRYADDAIDSTSGSVQRSALARLRAELAQVYDAEAPPASSWVLQGFRAAVQRRAIPREYPAELLAGMEMDVSGQRYETLPELLLYCHRVASTVGLMMCHVFGVSDPAALRHAAHLGVAMQLTNICRDVEEDWRRGRLYLPLDMLRREGASDLSLQELSLRDPRPQDPRLQSGTAARDTFPGQLVEPCRGVLVVLLALAERHYASGDAGLRFLPWRAALAVCVARRVYAAIGSSIARAGHDVTAGRAVVLARDKLVLAGGALPRVLAARRGATRLVRATLPTVEYGPDLALL